MVWSRDLWHDGSLSSLWLCLAISVRDCEYFLFLLLRLWCSLIPTIYFSDRYGSRGPGNWFFSKPTMKSCWRLLCGFEMYVLRSTKSRSAVPGLGFRALNVPRQSLHFEGRIICHNFDSNHYCMFVWLCACMTIIIIFSGTFICRYQLVKFFLWAQFVFYITLFYFRLERTDPYRYGVMGQ